MSRVEYRTCIWFIPSPLKFLKSIPICLSWRTKYRLSWSYVLNWNFDFRLNFTLLFFLLLYESLFLDCKEVLVLSKFLDGETESSQSSLIIISSLFWALLVGLQLAEFWVSLFTINICLLFCKRLGAAFGLLFFRIFTLSFTRLSSIYLDSL